MRVLPDAAAAATRYDGASLRAAEEQRDCDQQAIIAELRRRYGRWSCAGGAARGQWQRRQHGRHGHSRRSHENVQFEGIAA
jgi:hypothetical protein